MRNIASDCACDLDIPGLGVMTENRGRILGLAHVKLKSIAAMLEGAVERCDGVFWNRGGGAGATMS